MILGADNSFGLPIRGSYDVLDRACLFPSLPVPPVNSRIPPFCFDPTASDKCLGEAKCLSFLSSTSTTRYGKNIRITGIHRPTASVVFTSEATRYGQEQKSFERMRSAAGFSVSLSVLDNNFDA
jgi:hypothetical protein